MIGRVTAIFPERMTARVESLSKDNMVSRELSVLMRGSSNVKDHWLPALGDLVVYFLIPGTSEGFIFGTYYNDEDPPKPENAIRHIAISDGTVIAYNDKDSVLSIRFNQDKRGQVIIENGDLIIRNGNVVA